MSSVKIAVIKDGFADSPYSDDELSADNRPIRNLISGDFSSADAGELSKAATVGAIKEFFSSGGGGEVLDNVEYHVVPAFPNYIELDFSVKDLHLVRVFSIEGTMQLNQLVVSTITTPPNFTLVESFPKRVYIRDDEEAGVSGIGGMEAGIELAIYYNYSSE